MLNQFNNFIFDLDGTLINSSEEVILCFKKAFKKANYPINETLFTSNVIGPPLKEIINSLAPELTDEDKINELIENFRELYDYDENDISVIFDGIYDFLLKLKNLNKKLFIATFKPSIPTKRLIKKFKFDMFDDVYTIDKLGKHITKTEMIEDIIKKYNLKKEETVMIGDAPSDVIAGNKAGITSIGVLWGYGSDKTNLIKNARICVNDVEELECLKLN